MKNHKLHRALMSKDVTYEYLSELMSRSTSYISSRMNNKLPWNMDEAFFIMDLINEDYSKIPEYFPRTDGKEKRSYSQCSSSSIDLLKVIFEAALDKLSAV